MKLTSSELATILHGLRMIQCEGRLEGCAAGDCEHFQDVPALTNEQIDDLCMRINFEKDGITNTIIGYAFDGEFYCLNCGKSLDAFAVASKDEPAAVFAGDEYDSAPVCTVCGEACEDVTLLHEDEEDDGQECDDCGGTFSDLVSCPDGSVVCRDCFNAGGH